MAGRKETRSLAKPGFPPFIMSPNPVISRDTPDAGSGRKSCWPEIPWPEILWPGRKFRWPDIPWPEIFLAGRWPDGTGFSGWESFCPLEGNSLGRAVDGRNRVLVPGEFQSIGLDGFFVGQGFLGLD